MFKWPVVPICDRQRRDIYNEDIIASGLYRLCRYEESKIKDNFRKIYCKRLGIDPGGVKFIVQMYGCPLSCHYCYVTIRGIWGQPVFKSSDELLLDFSLYTPSIFHLMGGAPALYLDYWKELADKVEFFHSDFLLIEKIYQREWVENLPGLHVVSLKDFSVDMDLLKQNLDLLVDCSVNFYLTFTGKPLLLEWIKKRYGAAILDDSFIIPIIDYKANQ